MKIQKIYTFNSIFGGLQELFLDNKEKLLLGANFQFFQ